MWPTTVLTDRLGLQYPIIQAPMAGGFATPALVAAVSNAGGLGALGVGYLSPQHIDAAIREVRALTDKPFAVNLFVPTSVDPDPAQIDEINLVLESYRRELGVEEAPPTERFAPSFDAQIEAVLEAGVDCVSFTFGLLSREVMQALKARGIMAIGTATSVREAQALVDSGVDALVAQGGEAGGHRGAFMGQDALVGTLALVPQIVDAVDVAVIAAGGIMDGRGIVAALALGAHGVQMGTAFLSCPESGAHAQHKRALAESSDASTRLTRAFSGKPARGIANRFIDEMEDHAAAIPPYPVQNALTRGLRQAAGEQDQTDFMSLWAGQASRLATDTPAGERVQELAQEVTRTLQRLSE